MAKVDAALAAGAAVGLAAASSAATLLAFREPVLGAAVAVSGALGGAMLALLGRERPPARRNADAGASANHTRTDEPTLKLRERPDDRPRAQRVAPPDHTDAPVATAGEMTLPTNFAPDNSAYAIGNLTEVYAQLRTPGIAGFLVVIAGPDRSRGAPIRESGLVTIGRGAHNSLQLQDASASVTQAAVGRENGKVLVRDVRSTNGTYVNNERIDERELEDCDVIAFGQTKILVALKP